MEAENAEALLRSYKVSPSAQRIAVASYVLDTDSHPSADQVHAEARKRLPSISRATVYNTLNLLVQKGLLRQLVLSEGNVVFDPNLKPHHHFLDCKTGEIHDIPWQALQVSNVNSLDGYDVEEYQVVLRGQRTRR